MKWDAWAQRFVGVALLITACALWTAAGGFAYRQVVESNQASALARATTTQTQPANQRQR